MLLLEIGPPVWLLKMLVGVLLGFWILTILAAAAAAVAERIRRKRFLASHPAHNTVKLRRENNGLYIRTDVFSVNGERAVFSGADLLIPLGEVIIYADFTYSDNPRGTDPAPLFKRSSPFAAIAELYHEIFYTVPQNDAGAYRISFVAEAGWEYVLKADSHAGEFLLTCICGEDGDILHFK